MELFDIVMNLNGPIEPIGDSGIDRERLDNLCELTELAKQIIGLISEVKYNNINHYESSRITASKQCGKFLSDIGIKD